MSLTNLNDTEPDDAYKQVELTLWHPGCWTLNATDEHEQTHLIEKSLYEASEVIKSDFILVSKGPSAVEDVITTIDSYDVVFDVTVLKHSENRARIVVTYTAESSIVPEIANSNFMPIEPVHITGGQEYWTVLVRASKLADSIEKMEEDYDVRLQSISKVDPTESIAFADVIERIHEDLSSRQRELMFEAHEMGYYNWPRDVAATDIAEETDISGSTFLEHIRRGEQKILQLVFKELERRYPEP